jgi:hypothetical protein
MDRTFLGAGYSTAVDDRWFDAMLCLTVDKLHQGSEAAIGSRFLAAIVPYLSTPKVSTARRGVCRGIAVPKHHGSSPCLIKNYGIKVLNEAGFDGGLRGRFMV